MPRSHELKGFSAPTPSRDRYRAADEAGAWPALQLGGRVALVLEDAEHEIKNLVLCSQQAPEGDLSPDGGSGHSSRKLQPRCHHAARDRRGHRSDPGRQHGNTECIDATCSAVSSMSTDTLHERVCAPFRVNLRVTPARSGRPAPRRAADRRPGSRGSHGRRQARRSPSCTQRHPPR